MNNLWREKTILHVDMNSYFATASQQANPRLRGKPVGIIKAPGRGCVIAASVEAKKFGVKTGVSTTEAMRLCPQINFVPADMDQYFSLTESLIRISSNYSPICEVFSIDELFLDLTPVIHLISGGAVAVAWDLKTKIKENLGDWMKASVGIGFSKLSAKLASEMKKPDGLTVLSREDCLDKTAHVDVGKVCGIGHAYTGYLHARGAFNLGQARRLELPEVIKNLVFLKTDEQLVTVSDLDPAKSVSRTFTTFAKLTELNAVEKLTRNLIEEAAMKLREMNMCARTFSMFLRFEGDFDSGRNFHARSTLKIPTNDPVDIFNLLWQKYMADPVLDVRQAGIWCSNLQPDKQLDLYPRRSAALKAADAVNSRWGLFTLYPARLLGGELIRPEVTGYLGDKYYRFNNN